MSYSLNSSVSYSSFDAEPYFHLFGNHRDIGFYSPTFFSGPITRYRAQTNLRDSTRFLTISRPGIGYWYETEMAIDGEICHISHAQDSILLVGNFSQLAGAQINQIAWSKPRVSSTDEPSLALDASVTLSANEIVITLAEPSTLASKLFLYSSDGKLIQQETLVAGQSDYRIPLRVSSRVLHYALRHGRDITTGSLIQLN